MNLKNVFQMEATINEWVSNLHLPVNMPLEIAEQMLIQYMQAIGKFKEQAAQQAAKIEEQNKQKDTSEKVTPLCEESQNEEQKVE